MVLVRTMLENSGNLEVMARRISSACGPIKRTIKRMLRGDNRPKSVVPENPERIAFLRQTLLNCGIGDGDIVIIHSSLDGLHSLGLSAEKVISLVLDVFSGSTVVFATFPISPKKKKTVYTYDPMRTLCGTGILPNMFLKVPGIVRSTFPFNSLSARGAHAEAMMEKEANSICPHDCYSAWEYCRQHHAKILFLGTTSREANTMAIHMIPDIMGDEWPIRNWYTSRQYDVKIGNIAERRCIQIQAGFWYRYVNEYRTDKALRDAGVLRKIGFDGIPIEIVDDSLEMSEFLIQRCKKGDLMYKIPRKYYKSIQK